jgi:hypothetical protein
MPTLTYNYKKFGPYLKPVIFLNIHYKKISRSTLALIDSGADKCIFHADLGQLLGIDVLSGPLETIGGIASDGSKTPKFIKGYLHKVGITIKGETRNIDALFSPDIADWGFAVLGQLGFFDKFESIQFDYKNHKIIIEA